MSQGPIVGFDPPLEPEPLPELEPLLEAEPLELDPPLELELEPPPPICIAMVPVVVGLVVCGVMDNVPPETQYAYAVPPEFVKVPLPDVLYVSVVDALLDTTPSPPGC
jgi:hypothetical protein